VRCPKCCYLPTQRTLGPTLYLYMNLWLEFDNCHSVAQMVIALYRHRRVTGLIPVRVPIHVAAFSATGLDFGPTIISG
jgi:hypothetical protein